MQAFLATPPANTMGCSVETLLTIPTARRATDWCKASAISCRPSPVSMRFSSSSQRALTDLVYLLPKPLTPPRFAGIQVKTHTEFFPLGRLPIAVPFHDGRVVWEELEGARGIEPPPGFADRADGFEARGARQHHCPLETGSIRRMSRTKNLRNQDGDGENKRSDFSA